MALLKAKTRFGDVSGIPCGYTAYSVFKGIPYAAPPLGHLRWAAPADPEPWEGVKHCDTFSPKAMQAKDQHGSFYQKEFFPVQEPMSEDCLYLNVWTPADSPGEKLPVMLWIHGGAYMHGYGHEIEFDGEAFCKRGVILVTINYRLGAFGYFAHPELSKANEKGVSGNYGLLDQIHALKWVSRNIEAFGGDPGNVTVFGQSAGGGSVISICSSPLAEGLVHKAIIQSAGGVRTLGGAYSLEEAEKFGAFIVEHSGLAWKDFQKLPAEEVLAKAAAANADFKSEFRLRLIPCTDGFILPRDPGAVIAEGAHLPIPYMTGWVSGDDRLFGDHGATEWIKLKNGDMPLFVYRFNHNPPGDDDAGAFHSSELWYIFGTLQRCWRPMSGKDYDLSLCMTDHWTSFAKTGRPNWTDYTAENPYIHQIPLSSAQ